MTRFELCVGLSEINNFDAQKREEICTQAIELLTAAPVAAQEPNDLADAAECLLAVLDAYPEQLVPINRDSVTVRRMRAAIASQPAQGGYCATCSGINGQHDDRCAAQGERQPLPIGNGDVAHMERMAKGTGPAPEFLRSTVGKWENLPWVEPKK